MKQLFIETYGCQMNVADSEVVASIMQMAGYELCDNIDAADAVFGQREEVQLVGRAEAVRRFRRALAGNRAVRKLGLSFHRWQV